MIQEERGVASFSASGGTVMDGATSTVRVSYASPSLPAFASLIRQLLLASIGVLISVSLDQFGCSPRGCRKIEH